MKSKMLKLNKYYFPVGVCDWREGIKNIFSEAAFPLDIQYSQNETGENLEAFEWAEPIKTWEEWSKLPVRPYDEYIHTSKGPVRMPSILICAEYDKIKWNKVLFPTKRNVWERDNYTCGYTGKKLSRDEVSVDHILPKSKGGEDTWLNLITCDKEVNRRKGDTLLEDTKLKLIKKPFVPKGGMTFPILRPEWVKFVAESAS